jgi:hypothetical protein
MPVKPGRKFCSYWAAATIVTTQVSASNGIFPQANRLTYRAYAVPSRGDRHQNAEPNQVVLL